MSESSAVTAFRAPAGFMSNGKTNSASAGFRTALEQQVRGWQKQREQLAVEIAEKVERLQDLDMTIAGAADMMSKIDREALMRNMPTTTPNDH